MPPVVIIGHFRYANAKLMGVGHDWLEENGDFSGFEGMTHAEAFHIVPDRGMGLFFFETKEKAQTAMPGMQQTMRAYAEMFECKVTWDLGFLNETLSGKLST
jgi:hypothetical protein